jgi:hypothetical protein
MSIDIDPVGVSVHSSLKPANVRIRDFNVQARAVVDYLRSIAPEKREIALAHALEVGIVELLRRRARAK